MKQTDQLETTILQRALDHAPVSVVITDYRQPGNPIVFVNRFFEEHTGYQRKEVVGLNPRFLHGADKNQPSHAELSSAIAAGRECSVRVRDFCKDGTAYWAAVSITPVLDENRNITHYIGIQRDITVDVVVEQLLQQDLAMATVMHDIKAPLIGAELVLTKIMDGRFGALPSEVDKILAAFASSNKRLLNLTENMLDTSRLRQSSGGLNLELLDLAELIAEVANQMAFCAKSQNCGLVVQTQSDMPCWRVDRHALSRVLVNLLDNAIKYSGKNGVVYIQASTDGDTFVVKVSDSGQGIPEKETEYLFKPFARLEEGKRHVTGWGLGLYVCQQFVEAHGGTISCESCPGSGTTFKVVLPRLGCSA